jgi:hypothetical protein
MAYFTSQKSDRLLPSLDCHQGSAGRMGDFDLMKRLMITLLLLGAQAGFAYEYRLQFTPPGGAQGLVIAGYQFMGSSVIGNCSYHISTAGSGRGSHGTTTYYYNTCSWDFYGNLLSLTPGGAPPAPAPITGIGTPTELVYAVSGTSMTGHDTRGYGFVNTPSSHYTWQTVSGGYAGIPDAPYSITATLISDGDVPLTLDKALVSTSVSGSITPSPGTATVTATTCTGQIAVGTSCSVTVIYNPKTIKCTASPYGFAYTKLDLTLVTDAGASTDFTMLFTVTGVKICDD